MSTQRERERFADLVIAWGYYVDDDDHDLTKMLEAILRLGDAMGFTWTDRSVETVQSGAGIPDLTSG